MKFKPSKANAQITCLDLTIHRGVTFVCPRVTHFGGHRSAVWGKPGSILLICPAAEMATKPSPAEGSLHDRGAQRVVFFHPDLGIGGAERLIVDAAVGLQNLGHKVTIFTSHCDPRHCFEEARDGKLLLFGHLRR